jgi:dihydropteroate synthase
MQAVLLNLDLIGIELASFGLSDEAIDLFRKQAASHLIRLRRIPESVVPLMKDISSSHNTIFLISPKELSGNGFIDAIIAGTEAELSKICAILKEHEGNSALVGNIISRVFERISKKAPAELLLGSTVLPLGRRTLIMGILNVTPDSFSDGGRFNQFEKALSQAYKMAEEGADIIDIGGESTRPGHKQIPIEEELKRVMPVINALKNDHSFKVPLSIDTYKAVVAETALEAGVEMLNDVWGLKEDSKLGQAAAYHKVPVCLMHNRKNNTYNDLIPDIIAEIEESIELAKAAGIEDSRIIIDPGIGFGKDLQQNLDVMLHLRDFCNLGYPLLLGTSRKSMIGKTLDLPVGERLEGTAATIAYGISAGADIIRVHDVLEMKRTALMTDAIVRR